MEGPHVARFVSQKSGKVIGEWLQSIISKARMNTEELLDKYIHMLLASNVCTSIKHLENTIYKTFDALLVRLDNKKNIGCLNRALREAVRQNEPYLDRLV